MPFISEKEVKVRKDHQCLGCLKVIPKGTIANRQTNVDGGKIYSIYTHTYCNTIMSEMLGIYGMDSEELLIEGCVTEYLWDIAFKGTPLEYVLRKEEEDDKE